MINARVVTVVLLHPEASRAPSIVRVRVNQFGHVPAVLIDPIDRKGLMVHGIWLGADLDDSASGTSYIRIRTGKWSPATGKKFLPKPNHLVSRCKTCGKEATFRRNPFFGQGLSIHEFIVQCSVSAHVQLVRTPSSSAPTAPLSGAIQVPLSRRRRVFFNRQRAAD